MPLPEFWNDYRAGSATKRPVFRNPEDPAEIISNMFFYSTIQKKLKDNYTQYKSSIEDKARKSYQFGDGFITAAGITQICGDYNIPLIKDCIVKPEDLHYFNELDYPLVIKGINKNVIHKNRDERG